MNFKLRILTLLFGILTYVGLYGYKLQVDGFDMDARDLSARTEPRYDLNERMCALIKIELPEGAKFEGNVVDYKHDVNEYWVYVSPGTKFLKIKYPGFETLSLSFPELGVTEGLDSGVTYLLSLSGYRDNRVSVPQDPGANWLILDITPKTGVTVKIDGQVEKVENGQTLSYLKYGNHTYSVEAAGYESKTGTVNVGRGDKITVPVHLSLTQNGYNHIRKAKDFTLKPHAEIGLGNSMSTNTGLSGLDACAHSQEYGLDFGYTFWRNGRNSLEVNVGLGYSHTGLKLDSGSFDFNYAAPADADDDGNLYQRYYEIRDLSQKVNTGYLTVPVYLDYRYGINNWLGVHADLGLKFGFKCSAGLGKVSGNSFSYGIYPEYDDLMIDADYLNDFGNRSLEGVSTGPVSARGFNASLLVGVGVEARIYGPLWFDLGLRYDCGFADIFKEGYAADKGFTAQSAPVTYTVADGTVVKPMTDYLSKSKLMPLSLRLGFRICF